MDYTAWHSQLRILFDAGTPGDGTGTPLGIALERFPFTSRWALDTPLEAQWGSPARQQMALRDRRIAENRQFSYPVLLPPEGAPHRRAIVLLHGLNERSWHKYLPWGYALARRTGRPVILFPIAFHMNRSPGVWANPRAMLKLLSIRRRAGDVPMASFANAALSQRLCDDPLRFFTSGRQSAEDILQLLQEAKAGGLPFLAPDAQVDFFAYSIGAFLAQVLFLANPGDQLARSRLFLFCGGALFSQMNGISKLIMDGQAFDSLIRFYLNTFPRVLRSESPLAQYIAQSPLGRSFRAMISPQSLTTFRNAMFRSLHDRVRAIALAQDRVIPAAHIASTLAASGRGPRSRVETLDFPYPYTHENPFPLLHGPNAQLVDRAFERVMGVALDFLR